MKLVSGSTVLWLCSGTCSPIPHQAATSIYQRQEKIHSGYDFRNALRFDLTVNSDYPVKELTILLIVILMI